MPDPLPSLPRANSVLAASPEHVPLGRVLRRYQKLAPVYERTLGERLLYAVARRRAVFGSPPARPSSTSRAAPG
jgi:hypothetical protein